jgi:transposase-like protein
MAKLKNKIIEIILSVIIKIIPNNQMSEYIWYCPRRECNAIILKTKEPILKGSSVYKCKRCRCEFSGDDIVKNNKKNIRKYLMSLT